MTRSRAKVGQSDTNAASEQPVPSKRRGKAAASAVADPVDIISGKVMVLICLMDVKTNLMIVPSKSGRRRKGASNPSG